MRVAGVYVQKKDFNIGEIVITSTLLETPMPSVVSLQNQITDARTSRRKRCLRNEAVMSTIQMR